MANEQAVEVRREKVLRRLIRGMSTQEIADQVHASVRTVQGDIKAVREQGGLTLSKLDAKEFIAMAAARQDELERESWFIYHAEAVSNSDKLKALKNISDIAKDRMEMYQSVGVIPSQDKGISVSVGIVGARCDECPYRARFTKSEIRAVLEGKYVPVEEYVPGTLVPAGKTVHVTAHTVLEGDK